MKIELEEQTEQKAEEGDIIKFNSGVVGLVLRDEKVVLLKFGDKIDWFELATTYKNDFQEGKYTILAKANEWKISKVQDS